MLWKWHYWTRFLAARGPAPSHSAVTESELYRQWSIVAVSGEDPRRMHQPSAFYEAHVRRMRTRQRWLSKYNSNGPKNSVYGRGAGPKQNYKLYYMDLTADEVAIATTSAAASAAASDRYRHVHSNDDGSGSGHGRLPNRHGVVCMADRVDSRRGLTAAGDCGGQIKLWDVRTRQLRQVMRAGQTCVVSAICMRDTQVVSKHVRRDVGDVMVWDIETGMCTMVYQGLPAHRRWIGMGTRQSHAEDCSLHLGQDGRLLYVNEYQSVGVYDVRSGSQVMRLTPSAGGHAQQQQQHQQQQQQVSLTIRGLDVSGNTVAAVCRDSRDNSLSASVFDTRFECEINSFPLRKILRRGQNDFTRASHRILFDPLRPASHIAITSINHIRTGNNIYFFNVNNGHEDDASRITLSGLNGRSSVIDVQFDNDKILVLQSDSTVSVHHLDSGRRGCVISNPLMKHHTSCFSFGENVLMMGTETGAVVEVEFAHSWEGLAPGRRLNTQQGEPEGSGSGVQCDGDVVMEE